MELFHDRIYYYILCQQAKHLLSLQISIVQFIQNQFEPAQNTIQNTLQVEQDTSNINFPLRDLVNELDDHCTQMHQTVVELLNIVTT